MSLKDINYILVDEYFMLGQKFGWIDKRCPPATALTDKLFGSKSIVKRMMRCRRSIVSHFLFSGAVDQASMVRSSAIPDSSRNCGKNVTGNYYVYESSENSDIDVIS